MIVDCHTQVWDSACQLGRASVLLTAEPIHADTSHHLRAVDPVDRAIVLGFKSRFLEAEIPNHFVADYVRRYADKLVGFAGIDPTDPACLSDLALAHEQLGLKGVTLSPALQNYHPADTRAQRVYEECARRGMPVLFEQNLRIPHARMEFARPMLLDEIASEYPGLRIVIGHMGFPWIHETVVLLGKHRHVMADVAGLLPKRWLTYNALLSAYEYGVLDKLLFGSDFPYRSPAACIEALYSINQLSHGTNLMAIPREQLRGIVERDALSLLGIQTAPSGARRERTKIVDDE
jgi:predicted TIM-barrel fold metal-dependent hydrolase